MSVTPIPRVRSVPGGIGVLPSLLVLALLLGGCRGDAPRDDLPVRVQVATAPTPAIVGPIRMVLDVHDEDGNPVEATRVEVEGTMTHAGMVPVHATATKQDTGRWIVPEFEFTMGGDWILFVTIELPDGREAIREHSLSVMGRDDRSS